MKKLLISLAFVGFFTFVTPKILSAEEPCAAIVITCPDGTEHIVVVCDTFADTQAWAEILCGLATI